MVLSPKTALKSHLNACQSHVGALRTVSANRNDVLRWFQGLCEHLTSIIVSLTDYRKENTEKVAPIQNSLLLYLTQTLTCLALQINVFVQEEELVLVLTEARNCVTKQLQCCLDSFAVTVETEAPSADPAGSFVKWMDAALDKISQVTPQTEEIYEESKELFEEVLSHAMSIAQVSLNEDSKIIRGSCQAVLGALSSLGQEIQKTEPNGAMVRLFIDSSSDKLCLLEKKVNVAVLRLCLYTFSRYEEPLEKIRIFCFNKDNRSKMGEELDGLVADFDLHLDRIMQIGLFAVSCSSESARGIKIRSCLASLEALEGELVPALTAVLLDNSVHNSSCADILIKHWLNQAYNLQLLIFLIIDPFAFCHVIYEQITEIVTSFTNKVKQKCVINQNEVDIFLKTVRVLQTFIAKTRSEFNDSENSKIGAQLADFNNVVKEVKCASDVLLNEQNRNLESSKRVLKRCKILQTIVKRLWYCFADDYSDPTPVQKLPNDSQPEPTGNVLLDHIINRGKQILQDRSILYKTPIKTGNKCKALPLLKLVHLRQLSFVNGSTKNQTSLDLQITDILNEMSNLSTTFKRNNYYK